MASSTSGGARLQAEGSKTRHLGLLGATGVGVGAIVGGGILALAGTAFAISGPSAILAFLANGIIALVTAHSFGRLARRFPESGGTYTFAKKVFSVEAAFLVGWVVWFASIVAAVLYALGFATFALVIAERLWLDIAGATPAWLRTPRLELVCAWLATGVYTAGLVRRSGGGGNVATVGKVVVFAFVILGGALAYLRSEPGSTGTLRPFFFGGGTGLIQAMGYTFIALQGFDLIAAVGGEVRDPERNLPRSMRLSLVIALGIYLPLLAVCATVGVPAGGSITDLAARDPEALLANAAERFLGPTGYWLVAIAAVLSMLSALRANLYGASRVAQAMARDHTLPDRLAELHPTLGTPANAVLATSAGAALILLVVPDVATAGASSSLIFLITFAIAHWTSLLASQRSGDVDPEQRDSPWVPVLGGGACLLLALFQGFAVRAAGALVVLWLGAGLILYLSIFAWRARVADAAAEARDPDLVKLRGRSPLVLVPIANPASTLALIGIARAMVTPKVGRALVLTVVKPPDDPATADLRPLRDMQAVVGNSLQASFERALAPETLITVAREPWAEIVRVARVHRCESLLIGLGDLRTELGGDMEELLARVDCDVVVLRAPLGWTLGDARRVLVPLGGRGDQSRIRARLLASVQRMSAREIAFLRVLPSHAPPEAFARAERELRELASAEAPGPADVELASADDVAAELIRRAPDYDLIVLGTQRRGRHRKVMGRLALRLARETDRALLLISRRG